jgi:hypothetical protein
MYSRGLFPLRIIYISALNPEQKVLELFKQPNIDQRVVEPIVVNIDFGLGGIELIPLNTDTESLNFLEPKLR